MAIGILAHARAAGASGRTWGDYTCNDEELAAYCEDHAFDTDAIAAAFEQGRLEHKARTWVTRWTTAPVEYDGMGTEDLGPAGEWRGKPLRRVLIEPRSLTWQVDRYASGLHGAWEEDPNTADAREREKRERWAREDAERNAKRAAALAELTTMETAHLQHLHDLDEPPHGLEYGDVRDELKRRRDAAQERDRLAEIERCRALVPAGATLIDDGAPSTQGRWGRIPGRDPNIWYDIEIGYVYPHMSADDVVVWEQGGASARAIGGLESVAEWLTSGHLRTPRDGEMIPPRPVVERVGRARWKHIRRYEIRGRVVYVAPVAYSMDDPWVLDENGKKVRGKLVQDAVAAWRADPSHY